VDAAGDVYVAGLTSSKTFPVTSGAWQTSLGSELFNGFITKLKPDGSGLLYSTYLPGGQASVLVLDASGDVFAAGSALGTTFPTTAGAVQSTRYEGNQDAFVLKLNAAGTGVIYSTLLGGTFADVANALAVDADGNAYVAGYTASVPPYADLAGSAFVPFPTTTGALNVTTGGADMFVSKVNSTGTTLVYSAVFGGNGNDSVQSIVIDGSGAAYFGGYTYSVNFPVTPGAWRRSYGEGVAGKLNSAGSALVYATFLTGSAGPIAVDDAGEALLLGYTYKSDLPTTPNALTPCFPAGGSGDTSAFPYVVKLNAEGTGAQFSTYLRTNLVASNDSGRVWLRSATKILDEVNLFAAPPPGILCAVNAATYRGPAIAPGEIVTLFGSQIGPQQPSAAELDGSGKVSTTLGGTRVLIGGAAAPLLYVSSNQINLVAPFEIAGQTQTTVQIETNGARILPPFETQVVVTAPGIFTLDGSGYGQAAALNQDGTLNSPGNPADQGSIVTLYVTGMGAMSPQPVDGSVPARSSAKPAAPVRIYLTGAPFADVQYAGDAPGLVEGAVQLNIVVPKVLQTGPQVVTVVAGDGATPLSLNPTIYVR
jgi:uncharacterized protein (TIGR03437 family)